MSKTTDVQAADEWAHDRAVITAYAHGGTQWSHADDFFIAQLAARRWRAALTEIDRLRKELADVRREGFNAGIDAAAGVCKKEMDKMEAEQVRLCARKNYDAARMSDELYGTQGAVESLSYSIAALKQPETQVPALHKSPAPP